MEAKLNQAGMKSQTSQHTTGIRPCFPDFHALRVSWLLPANSGRLSLQVDRGAARERREAGSGGPSEVPLRRSHSALGLGRCRTWTWSESDTHVDRVRPAVAQVWAKCRQSWPGLRQFCSNLVDNGPSLVTISQVWPALGRTWPKAGPSLANVGLMWSNRMVQPHGPTRANLWSAVVELKWQHRPTLAHLRPKPCKFGSRSAVGP